MYLIPDTLTTWLRLLLRLLLIRVLYTHRIFTKRQHELKIVDLQLSNIYVTQLSGGAAPSSLTSLALSGNLQKLSGLTWHLISFRGEKDPTKVNAKRASESQFKRLNSDARTVGFLWVSYVGGAVLGAEAATHEWFNGSANWTLMIPSGILLVCIFLNEGPASVPPPKTSQSPLLDLLKLRCARLGCWFICVSMVEC